MLIVAVFVFLLLKMAPGDPATIIAGDNATAENIAQLRATLGLDQPVWTQLAIWLGHIARGDLGSSIFSGTPVTTLILERIGPTCSLALMTILVSVVPAIGLGVLAAARAGSWIDRLIMAFAVLGFSVPVFVAGYLFVFEMAIRLQWLPVQGYTPLAEGFWGWLTHLLLPALTMGLGYMALITRITRGAMLDVLSEDYMRTARAKGVGEVPAVLHHALKNAAVPIVTVIGNGVALLIGGVVITETVFNIPGIGRLVVDAIARRDYPIIQGVILVFSAVYVLINLLVDLSYSLVDPRIRG
jgi:peptide/nickel transport system permease protein